MQQPINNNKERQDKFLEEFPNFRCNISKTCKAIGINRSTYYRWKDENEDFAEGLLNAKEEYLDNLEDTLLKKALGFEHTVVREKVGREGEIFKYNSIMYFPPCFQSLISLLNAQGRGRGYAMKADESDANNNTDG